ncbi:MAG: sarcosine oxidase subunit alpha family protein [bacterium]|nr:sarcosine oxidase subunit alpha family protein [bacterium]
MNQQCNRSSDGGMIDRSKIIKFQFDGRAYEGHPGDTLASALLANGVILTARSFKYHRPRGICTAGPEEPNALVTLGRKGRSEPNIAATVIELFEGLEARSQNRWPSLRYDLLAVNSLIKPLLSAGFYYKTFMWPRSFWYALYEPMIRRAAGLGALQNRPDPDRYEHAHIHCDILIVGAGPAGLVAAKEASRSGARVLLVDDQPRPGGYLSGESLEIDGQPGAQWAHEFADELRAMDNVRMLARTTVTGRYDGMTFCAVERVSDHLRARNTKVADLPRQRLWTIHAEQFICAAGAIERPLVFDDNDRPGVMLAGAARRYLNQYGVLPGREVLIFTNNDDAYLTARDLSAAGADVIVIDTRKKAPAAKLLPGRLKVFFEHALTDVSGHNSLSSATMTPLVVKGPKQTMRCDLICISGGWNPTTHLLSHLGQKPQWSQKIAAYTMIDSGSNAFVTGGAAGLFELTQGMEDAAKTGRNAARACGFSTEERSVLPLVSPNSSYAIEPFWRLPKQLSDGSKSFVDLQNDVTVGDLELSEREGFGHAEHAKRYTTLGMGTDQGKLSNVNALGLLAELRDQTLSETGTTTYRPLYGPVALGALAGQRTGAEFAPVRHSAMHDWHAEQGAVFTHAGLWLRPYYYPRGDEGFATAVTREVRAVRSGVGMVDVSTLGKIEMKGPDAGNFLDHLYINSFSKMKIGRARYGAMLREDGMMFDDGTVSRLSREHYFITVTTVNAASVLQHMEFCHQTNWPELDVQFCSVSEAWSAMAVAGPKSREVLERVVEDLAIDNGAFPFMAVGNGTIGGAFVRIFRISFSGELAFEVYTDASYGQSVWEAIMRAGQSLDITAYGTEAMTVMRTEKGHVAGPELDGRTTAADLGLGRMMSQKKDFVGRRMAVRDDLVLDTVKQLVGLKPLLEGASFKMGAHLVEDPTGIGANVSQGHVTTAVYSPACDHFIGLALLSGGRNRVGERLYAVSPLHNEQVEVVVSDPVFVDPAGERTHV